VRQALDAVTDPQGIAAGQQTPRVARGHHGDVRDFDMLHLHHHLHHHEAEDATSDERD
jgi:hypothetical protein